MLEAGPELDAEVAEKVMGWYLSDDGYFWLRANEGQVAYATDDPPFSGGRGPRFMPSIDIAAAWQVVEYMQGRELTDFSVSWDVRNDSWCWVARFARTEATGPTAPLAICRAALAAVSPSSAASGAASPES